MIPPTSTSSSAPVTRSSAGAIASISAPEGTRLGERRRGQESGGGGDQDRQAGHGDALHESRVSL